MTITKPAKTHTFVPATVAKSSEVNTNFDNAFVMYETNGFLFNGWYPLATGTLEFNSANSFRTTADVNLTNQLQVGDKMTWEHTTTGGDRFAFITAINYNSTVANRTYIEVYCGTDYSVLNEAIVSNTVGYSRDRAPFGFPLDRTKWRLTFSDSGTSAFRNNTTLGEINSALRLNVPKGNWIARLYHHGGISNNSAVVGMYARMGLSTSTSAFSDNRGIQIYRTRDVTSTNQYRMASSGLLEFPVVSASDFTLYILGQTIDANTEITPNFTVSTGGASPIIIEAEIAYIN
jgi:hypothetical protein